MSQNDVDEPVATSVDSNSESDHANDLILYESDSRNGSGSSEDEKRGTVPHDTLVLWPIRLKHWNDKQWQSNGVQAVTLRKSSHVTWFRPVYHVVLASRLHAHKYEKLHQGQELWGREGLILNYLIN